MRLGGGSDGEGKGQSDEEVGGSYWRMRVESTCRVGKKEERSVRTFQTSTNLEGQGEIEYLVPRKRVTPSGFYSL